MAAAGGVVYLLGRVAYAVGYSTGGRQLDCLCCSFPNSVATLCMPLLPEWYNG